MLELVTTTEMRKLGPRLGAGTGVVCRVGAVVEEITDVESEVESGNEVGEVDRLGGMDEVGGVDEL